MLKNEKRKKETRGSCALVDSTVRNDRYMEGIYTEVNKARHYLFIRYLVYSQGEGITVVFEYTQAVLLLVYYWIKSLGRILLVQKIVKNVENDIILVTGAGKLCKLSFEIIYHISFVAKVLDLVEVLRNDSPHTVQLSYFGM